MTVERNYLHVIWRVPVIILWLLVMPLLFFLIRGLGFSWYRELPHYFHRGLQIIFGLRVTTTGEMTNIKPSLFVSNHISYLDIFVLGEIRAFFVAKSEVAKWPVLGVLARFQNTLFVERKAARARQQLAIMRKHLLSGQSLILFPEGTSTNGTYVEPFKSSLFEAARTENGPRIAIQPITVVYTHQAGNKMNQEMRDCYAWYADMPFTPHFFGLFSLKKVDVIVHFHPVTYIDDFASRKDCADLCTQLVRNKMNEILKGE